MATYRKQSILEAPADLVFRWHERPEALEMLTPPWERVRVVDRRGEGVAVGTRVTLELAVGPFRRRWTALHTACDPGRSFTDEQLSGPFAEWVHTHIIEPLGPDRSRLTDQVKYKLPFGLAGRLLAGWYVRRKIEKLFAWRHQVTRRACAELAARLRPAGTQDPERG